MISKLTSHASSWLKFVACLGLVWAISSHAQNSTVDVTSQFSISRSGYVFNRTTNTYDAVVTLKNGGSPASAPIMLVLSNISPGTVSLSNGAGVTPDGKPYVTVPVSGSSLQSGATVSVNLKFANPSRVSFSYVLAVLATMTDIGKNVSFSGPPPLPLAALDALPKNPETGRPILISLPEGNLEFDPTLKDSITAAGACMDWVISCVKPGERELDDCARSAPKCKTNTPWEEAGDCCPSTCFDQYRTARLAGTLPAQAFLNTYVGDASCFPGFNR